MIPESLDLRHFRRRLAARFFAILDSQGVVFFQAIVYVLFAIGGLYNAFVAHGVPTDVGKALGHPWSGVWLAMHTTLVICLAGKLMDANQRFWVRTLGLYFQCFGDVCAFGAFGGYVLASAQESKWGEPLSSPFAYTALALCAFFLCWRDLRRIIQAERRVRR